MSKGYKQLEPRRHLWASRLVMDTGRRHRDPVPEIAHLTVRNCPPKRAGLGASPIIPIETLRPTVPGTVSNRTFPYRALRRHPRSRALPRALRGPRITREFSAPHFNPLSRGPGPGPWCITYYLYKSSPYGIYFLFIPSERPRGVPKIAQCSSLLALPSMPYSRAPLAAQA